MNKKCIVKLNSRYVIRQLQDIADLCETERQMEVLNSLIYYINDNKIDIPSRIVKQI